MTALGTAIIPKPAVHVVDKIPCTTHTCASTTANNTAMDTREQSLSDFFGILSESPSPKRQGRISQSTSDLSLTGLLSEHAVPVVRDISDNSHVDSSDMHNSFASRETYTVDPDEVDLLMAQRMMQISMKEREEVYCDLHGVADEVIETPELIMQAISNMKLELSKFYNAAAYQQALAKDSKYVHSQEFLLRFLRAERFDVVRAASRLVNFYSLKLQAFGLEKLTQDISQEDLTENERKGLYESMTYDLPFRDRAGRAILFKMGTSVSVPMNELLRRGVYAVLSYSRDEENQKKGLVIVAYHMGDEYRPEDAEQRGKVNEHWGRLFACLPVRFQAIHCCFDSKVWRPTTANFRMSVDLFSGLRTMVRELSLSSFLLSLCSSTSSCLSRSTTVITRRCVLRYKHTVFRVLDFLSPMKVPL